MEYSKIEQFNETSWAYSAATYTVTVLQMLFYNLTRLKNLHNYYPNRIQT